MKNSAKRKLSVSIICGLLLSSCILTPLHAAEPEDDAPVVSFEYCGISFLPDKTGPDGLPYRYLDNDLFYIEYPGSWSFGTNKLCPIVFFNHSEIPKTTHDFETFQDSALIGTEDQIDQYIQGGGLNQYLTRILHLPDTAGCQFDTQTKEQSILVYSMKKDGETIASIIVWTSFGQVSIRDERSDISIDPARDYGDIMVMPVSDSEDFHSIEAIQAYVDSGKLNSRLHLGTDILTWTTKPYETAFHTYMLCEGSCSLFNIAIYIPVTPEGKKRWMVSFSADKKSEISHNAYQIREDIIKSFKALK